MIKKIKFKLTFILILLAFWLINVLSLNIIPNKVTVIEEQIDMMQTEIEAQKEYRAELILDIITYIREYDEEKADMLMRVLDARGIETDELVKHIVKLINNVADDHPELLESEEYKRLISELTNTENLIASARNAYNAYIDKYDKYIKNFFNKYILSAIGYEVNDYEKLDIETSESVN